MLTPVFLLLPLFFFLLCERQTPEMPDLILQTSSGGHVWKRLTSRLMEKEFLHHRFCHISHSKARPVSHLHMSDFWGWLDKQIDYTLTSKQTDAESLSRTNWLPVVNNFLWWQVCWLKADSPTGPSSWTSSWFPKPTNVSTFWGSHIYTLIWASEETASHPQSESEQLTSVCSLHI